MCNNILQYGHFYAWGKEHGRTVVSMRFASKFKYFHICNTKHHNFLTYVIAKYAAKWGLIPTLDFQEPDYDYSAEEQIMLDRKYVTVMGWEGRWYDLFLKYKQEIIDLFTFRTSITKTCEPLLAAATHNSCRLGIHIRRGDYATWKGGKYFFTDEVFIRLIKQFIMQHPNTTIYICGNDPSLDKALYQKEFTRTKIIYPCGNPGEDLYLLSQCDYLIGPPSTFSLVAAMYRDVPLYWIEDVDKPISQDSFKKFDYLFQYIL